MQRIDSMLRSLLYSHFSESLTGMCRCPCDFIFPDISGEGLPTLRTYGEIPRFLKENAYYIDLENRALILTMTNQR